MAGKNYKKPNRLLYRFFQFIFKIFWKINYKPIIKRNELKGHKGGCVVLLNHESSLDFLYSFCSTRRICTFVMSKSFHDTLPCTPLVNQMRVIAKQQFQSNIADLSKMKAVCDANQPLIIFPSGLMTESGLSTPIPSSTYKFLKFLNVDVFIGKISGSYYVNAKWRKGFRKGKTTFDLHKIFSKEELNDLSVEEIKKVVDKELIFDAYADQEKDKFIYKNNSDINGLEKVLYKCPKCGKEGHMIVKNNNQIVCEECGYSETCDEFGFLHVDNKNDVEYRHVSKWDQHIYDELKKEIHKNPNFELKSKVTYSYLNEKKHKFEQIGEGVLTLNKEFYSYVGTKNGEDIEIKNDVKGFFILPNNPIKNTLEFQHGSEILKFTLIDNNQYVTKWIHSLKIFYEMNNGEDMRVYPKED